MKEHKSIQRSASTSSKEEEPQTEPVVEDLTALTEDVECCLAEIDCCLAENEVKPDKNDLALALAEFREARDTDDYYERHDAITKWQQKYAALGLSVTWCCAVPSVYDAEGHQLA